MSCDTYLPENGRTIGCKQPCDNASSQRFSTFFTKLVYGNQTVEAKHDLRNRVLLHPPVNLTIQKESDSNVWLYWNQTMRGCVESEVCSRINDNKWETSKISTGMQSFCINLPNSKYRYELKVRSKFGSSCGESIFWSNWSEPVVWGSNNSTDTSQASSMSVLTPVLYVVGAITLIILVLMLLHCERLRVILIPVVPKPSLIDQDMENWLQSSKGLNSESFKANYNERACTVREYCQVTQFDSESSDGSACSVTTFQTDCSVSIPANKPEDLSPPSSSSTSTVTV
ncbi:cytokine receptor common subunit gamma-like isoform X2 [Betta splendens]|nr:cytokine receptor common subunit gamma-like isoform X2 [Betta splendens]XP_029029461.1 cytokine receptor common subunit gamma-like isoform X2 [Betta splendens]